MDDFQKLNEEEALDLLHRLSVDALKEQLPFLDESLLLKLPPFLKADTDPAWQEKLIALVEMIKDAHLLEKIGKKLSISQLIFLIQSAISKKQLSSIFMGIPASFFETLLEKAPHEVISKLKEISFEEPLQHQLTLFSHKAEALLNQIDKMLQALEHTPPNSREEIDHLLQNCLILNEKLQKALSLAWSTSREDLIALFSRLKETITKILTTWIGEPRSESSLPSGLYQKWEETKALEAGLNALQDEDPAIEGLAQLSLWSAEDYQQLGILPSKENLHVEKIQERLSQMGIKSVSDLKRLGIFSKEAMENHLRRL